MTVLCASRYGVYCQSWCPTPPDTESTAKFQQKASRFWEFEETSGRWVEISYPFDLISCVNGNCTKVGSIENRDKVTEQANINYDGYGKVVQEISEQALPMRKRVSLTRLSEASLWVTGQGGSIYERFWNGVEWVIAAHDLPTSAGRGVSVFIVNQTILSLSEVGMLYQVTKLNF